MATHPGSRPLPEPEGWTPAAVEAVRHASAKKYQGLLVVLPVKSSLMSVCPCAASGAASAASAANRARKVPKVFRFMSLTTQADDALRDLVSAFDDCNRGLRSAIAVGIDPVSLARLVFRDAEILDIEAGRGVVGLVAHVHRQAGVRRRDVHVRGRVGDTERPGEGHVRYGLPREPHGIG